MRDLARVGWRGLAPFLPIGPHKRPRLADSFSRLGQARGASPGSTSDPKTVVARADRLPRNSAVETNEQKLQLQYRKEFSLLESVSIVGD